jgi:outer membrane protein
LLTKDFPMSFSRAGLASMSPALKPLVGALVLAFGALGAQAQSLSEVVGAARGYDATYLGARSSADAARYRYDQARALHLPSANAVVTAGRQTSDTPYQPSQTSGSTNSASATISASQTLFNRQNDLSIDEAQKSVDIANSQLAQAEQDLIVRVSQAYFNVLAAADALQSVQGNSKAIAEQLASAKRNFEVGNATITDTREAEARADLARSQQIAAENDLLVSHLSLDQLVGRTGVQPHPLALPATLPPVVPSQVSDWVAMAEADSQNLKQARLGLELAELETSRAKAGHLPTVALNAQYGRSRQSTSYSTGDPQLYGPGGQFTGNGNSGGVSVTLSVPLFAGFAIQNRVRETLSLEEKARTDLEGARNGVTLGTRTAFFGAVTQRAQVQALEAAESSSKLALDATQLGYKVGVKVNLDVLNAQSQLYSTQRDLAGARYNYLLSTLKLRQAAGNLTGNDLLPIDALLVK